MGVVLDRPLLVFQHQTRQAQLVPGWVIVFGRVNHLGAETGTQVYSS